LLCWPNVVNCAAIKPDTVNAVWLEHRTVYIDRVVIYQML